MSMKTVGTLALVEQE